MLILRIRQAEVAADAGRLDEAYDLVQRDPRFKAHRRGQEAITRIVSAYVRRGREHLTEGRLSQTGADCEKAGRLGGDSPDVVQLRSDLQAAYDAKRRGERDAAVALVAAKRHVEAGALSVGARLVATVDDSRARRLMTDIDDHRSRLEAAIAAAGAAQERGDLSAAADAVARARAIAPNDARIAEVACVVSESLSHQIQSEIETGRIDRAVASADLLLKADPDATILREAERALEFCRRAWECVEHAKPHDAAEALRRASVLFPKAKWIADTLKLLEVVTEATTHLRAGPLAFIADSELREGEAPAEPKLHHATHPRLGRSHALQSESCILPERFILQVDGAGAFLVVRNGITKIGPISSAAMPEVALIADATAPAITIERVEDDYFLRSPSPITVNDKPVTEALLTSGDRICLSPRCRFTFSLPHAASTTAVLDLVGARYPRGDVRRVILLDRDVVIGATATAHVRASGLTEPLMLNLRNGLLRPSLPATASGKPLGREEGLPLGVPVSAGGAGFVITRV
jgi:tetratricopeptide (TPR) repeat protein